MNATRAIQVAVARADLIICQARASPLGAIAAALAAGLILAIIIHRREIHD